MQISREGLALIKESESWSAVVYCCAAGKPTIGWGHVVLVGEHFSEPIAREQGEELLRKDLAWVERCVNIFVRVPLTQNEFDALCSLVFNIGSENFHGSTLLRLLNQGRKPEAADQFRRWNKGRDPKTKRLRVLGGLVERREKERALFQA